MIKAKTRPWGPGFLLEARIGFPVASLVLRLRSYCYSFLHDANGIIVLKVVAEELVLNTAAEKLLNCAVLAPAEIVGKQESHTIAGLQLDELRAVELAQVLEALFGRDVIARDDLIKGPVVEQAIRDEQ